jgi:hypothetical protein
MILIGTEHETLFCKSSYSFDVDKVLRAEKNRIFSLADKSGKIWHKGESVMASLRLLGIGIN